MADSQPIQALPTPTEVTTVLVKDPQVQMAWNEVVQQHKGTLFLGYEIGWILIIWIIKAWRLTKAMTLFSRLWTQAWIGIVFWVVSATVVPILVWDGAYQTLLGQVMKALLKHFFE